MKPARFDYHRATTVEDAIDVLADEDTEAKLIAGGQSLAPLMNMRLATPQVLVDLSDLHDLGGVRNGSTASDSITVGALTTHRELAEQQAHPLLAEAAAHIGHAAIRNRGTIGGSIAHADPNAELPLVTVACNATLTANGPTGSRLIRADDFYRGMFDTALADDELLTEIEMARPTQWGFAEYARRDGDFALVAVAVAHLDDGWRVVVGGVDSTPLRCVEAETLLDSLGSALTSAADPVAEAVIEAVTAYDDLHASAHYRRVLAGELSRRATLAAIDQPAPEPRS